MYWKSDNVFTRKEKKNKRRKRRREGEVNSGNEAKDAMKIYNKMKKDEAHRKSDECLQKKKKR